MPGLPALLRLAGCAVLLAAGAPGPARAADPLAIDRDGTVRMGTASSGIVVEPGGTARLGAAGNGLVVDPAGAVRIGSTAAPSLAVDGTKISVGTSLNFGNRLATLITLWNPTYTIGIQPSTMYFRTNKNFAWFQGGTHADTELDPGTGGTSLMALSSAPPAGKGTLDVGGAVSAKSLDLRTAARTGDGHPKAAPTLYVTGTFPPGRPDGDAAAGVEFRHSNGTQGIGIGYNTIYATGSIDDQPLRLEARGKSNVVITGNGNLEMTGTLYLNNNWTISTTDKSLSFARAGQTVMVINDGERLQYNMPGLGVYYLGNDYNSIGYRWATWDSDARLKEDIAAIPSAMAKVRTLRGVTFRWNDLALERRPDLPSGRQVGVIAQDVEAVLPEAVTEGADGYKAVEYRDLIPLLIQALKEQDAAATSQAARIAALEAELAGLKDRIGTPGLAAAVPAAATN
jgi:hypothetical protein